MTENIKEALYQSPDMWLLNLGYVSEHSEQNLILYGYISTRGVVNVELAVDSDKYVIKYAVVLCSRSYFVYMIQKRLESKNGLLSKLMLLCFLKFFGTRDPSARIARCVRDYAGNSWKTSVEVLSAREYNEASAKAAASAAADTSTDDRAKGWLFANRP